MKSFKIVQAFLFFFMLFAFTANAQTQIGEIQGGVPVITANTATMISNMNTNLYAEEGIDAGFTTVEIVEFEGGYILAFSGGNGYVSTFTVTESGGNLAADGKISCTTTICSSNNGCRKRPNGTCTYCSDCVRTETVTDMF